MRHTKVSMSFARSGRSNPVLVGLPVLLLPTLAMAQNAAVSPADTAPAPNRATTSAATPAATVPSSIANLVGQPRIDIELNDVPVAKALEMISKFGEVNIVLGIDVDKNLMLPYISLKAISPEEALQIVATSANLQVQRIGTNRFLVAKSLPNSLLQAQPQNPGGSSTFGSTVGSAGSGFAGGGTSSSSPLIGLVPDAGGMATERPPVPKLLIPQTVAEAPTATLPELLQQYDDSKGRSAMRAIPVRNVRPGMMAYWLDPVNQDKPIEDILSDRSVQKGLTGAKGRSLIATGDLSAARGNLPAPARNFNNPYADDALPLAGGAYGQFRSSAQFGNVRGGGRTGNQRGGNRTTGGNRTGGDVFDLPEGVDKIIAIDSQNVLLVYGTEEGVRELESLISYLDRQIQQVEIEAQFVAVTNTDVRQFGIDFSSSNGPFTTRSNGLSSGDGTFSLGIVRGNFQATLNALVTNRRAKSIQSPRITTLNNYTADVSFTTSTPFILTSTTSGIGGQVGQQQDAFVLETSIALTVTPTINADGTITVLMQPTVAVQDPQTSANSIPGFTEQTINTIANVRDGDTIALGGLRTRQVTRERRGIPILRSIPILGQIFSGVDNSSVDTDLIIFLTARIVHRADDVGGVAGT